MFRTIATIVLIVFTVAATGRPADAQQPVVTVFLRDGRVLSGPLDPRSDGNYVWLRFGSGSATIARRIARSSIVRLSDGEVLPDAPSDTPAASAAVAPHDLVGTALARNKVVCLDAAASLANWDADVEDDGLILILLPLDDQGAPVAVCGTLHAELFSFRDRGALEQRLPRHRQPERLARWTLPIRTLDDSSPRHWRLPFATVHPDFQPDLLNQAMLHLTLVVPGHGVFEHTVDPVVVRRFAPTRDALQQATGARFLPTEGLGRRD